MGIPDCRITYCIDSADRILSVGGAWHRAAAENGASSLCSSVLGSSLWEHIGGQETALLYRRLLDRLRGGSSPFELPLRCDSPGLCRIARLHAAACGDHVVFTCDTLQEIPRTHVQLLDQSAPRSADWLSICSWCKQVRLQGERWVEAEEAVVMLRLFERLRLPRLSHGICCSCRARALAVLNGDRIIGTARLRPAVIETHQGSGQRLDGKHAIDTHGITVRSDSGHRTLRTGPLSRL